MMMMMKEWDWEAVQTWRRLLDRIENLEAIVAALGNRSESADNARRYADEMEDADAKLAEAHKY